MTESGPLSESSYWRKCTTCKKLIGLSQKYWICSVSTCNRLRTDLVFCDLRCFDAHVPVMNHRDAGAYERTSPSQKTTSPVSSQEIPERESGAVSSREVLVVVSKVKAYIRSNSGMNTSDSVMDLLSDRVRSLADRAIQIAGQSGRKTILDRDI